MLCAVALAAPALARADSARGVQDVLKNLPSDVPYGIVCSAEPYVTVAPGDACYSPIGLGKIQYTRSNGRFMYAIVEDLNGDDLCFAGPVEAVEAGRKIAPAPDALDTALTLGCMEAFGQLEPVPKQTFVLWY